MRLYGALQAPPAFSGRFRTRFAALLATRGTTYNTDCLVHRFASCSRTRTTARVYFSCTSMGHSTRNRCLVDLIPCGPPHTKAVRSLGTGPVRITTPECAAQAPRRGKAQTGSPDRPAYAKRTRKGRSRCAVKLRKSGRYTRSLHQQSSRSSPARPSAETSPRRSRSPSRAGKRRTSREYALRPVFPAFARSASCRRHPSAMGL